MTLFGFIWMILLIACFPKLKNMIALTIISATIQCSNVIVVSGTGIGPQIITSIVFIIRVLINTKRNTKIKIKLNRQDWDNRQDWGIIRYLFLVLGVALISSIYNGIFRNSAIRLVQLFIYIICSMSMFYVAHKINEKDIYQLVRNLTIGMIIFGFIQLLITSGFFPNILLLDKIFFNEAGNYVYYNNDSGYRRMLGTYMEPSYFAGFVVGAFYYFLSLKSRRNENGVIIGLLGIQIILTFSSSAYGAFAIIGLLFILVSKEKKFKFYMIILTAIAFIGFYVFFYDTLDRVIFSKISMTNESYRARHGADRNAFKFFKLSPIIGNGYKSMRASSIIFTLLGELGIIGLLLYVILNVNIIAYIFTKKFKKELCEQEFSLSLAVLAVVATQVLAVPDLDICTYWMWLNILLLEIGIRNSIKHKGIVIKNKNL